MNLKPAAGSRSGTCKRPAVATRLAAAVATAAAFGCTSATPYRELAGTGVAYSKAVVMLTDAAAALAVDASSERLLQDDALAGVDLDTLRRFDREDSARIAVLHALAAHARLLSRYFALLRDLVDGKPGRATLAALDATADALDDAGATLRGTAPASAVRAARQAGATGLGFYGRDLARKEIAARAPALDRELATQRDLLATLGAALRHDAGIVAGAREQRLVVEPLLADEPVADPDRWLEERRLRLNAAPALAELAAAAGAADDLRDAIAAVAARQPALDLLAGVAADAEAIRAALAALGLWREQP
jgi:hypothetical protein